MTPLTDDLRATLYDAENLWAEDDDFFLALANERPASRVLDLGCGTGRLTTALAAAGHVVTGVDPDEGAVTAARLKPHAEDVDWVLGTSSALDSDATFDLVLMTAHVVQAIADPGEWRRTLADLHRVLVPGGRLAFDSRDPAARVWERWNPQESRGTTVLADGTQIEGWYEVTAMADGVVTLDEHAVLADGTHDVQTGELAFRDEDRLRADLRRAGFTVDHVFGGWHREPAGQGVGELVVVAHR